MGVRTYAVRDVGQEIEKTPVVPAPRHTRVRRRIPPADDDRHGKRPKQLHHVQRLVLYHHLVGDTCCHDDGEQCRECHAHLQYPPKRSLRTGKSRIRQKLVGLKDDIIYFLLQQVDAEIRKYISVCHSPVFLFPSVYTLVVIFAVSVAARLRTTHRKA